MAVKVKRERADQRRHHRVTAPLFVDVDGVRARTADWSLGGLRVESFPGKLPRVGDTLNLSISLPFQGFDVSFDAKAQVVRNDPERSMFAVMFTVLGERERELMQHFIEELVRGSMSDVEDTIQRIDVPVTPASLDPDPNPRDKVPVRRWPAKMIAMTALYAAIGLVVFGYAAVIGYSQFFRMQVETAVITAPVEVVPALGEGQVEWMGPKPGDQVRKGEVVLRLKDTKLEQEIDLADIAIQQKSAEIAFFKQRQSAELERLKSFAALDMRTVEQMKLEVEALAAEATAAEQLEKRLSFLRQKGWTTATRHEEAMQKAVRTRKMLHSKQVELKTQIAVLESNMGRRHYNGDNLIGDLDKLEAQARLAQNEAELARSRKQTLLSQRERLSVKAPFSGTLLALPRLDEGSVRKGDTIAIIEKRDPRHVTAYLNQDEVVRIGQGDRAMIYIPALAETLPARVRTIDRTTGFIRENDRAHNPGYSWRGPTDRSAKVTLEFENPASVRDAERYRSGLPVVVVFPQRSTNQLISVLHRQLTTLF